MFPFKGAALVCVATFESLSGIQVNYLAYVLVNIILSVIMLAVFMLLVKFIFKPDLRGFQKINVEQFKKNLLTKDGYIKTIFIKEKMTVFGEQFIFHSQPGINEVIALEDCELYFS